jgi:DNA/RNA-binding domain of Phe-tRNA-synthetase-like protein
MTHRLVIDAHIFEQFPDYQALILYGEEMKNFPSTQESIALLRSAEQECRNMFTLETLAQHPHIAAWRDASRRFGAKPKKYPFA